MKVMNVNESVPEIFYVFIGQGKNLQSQANYINYKLTKRIISSGFNSIIASPENIINFIDGNINYAPYIPNKTTLNVPSSHMLSVVNGYTTEYALESYRYNNFKRFPSRFSCIYAFGDWQSCELANKYYGWELKDVKKFKLKDFSEVNCNIKFPNEAIKICKCNMEIVTYLWNHDLQFFPPEEGYKFCAYYWNGGGEVASEKLNINTKQKIITNSGVLYEYLIEGILEEVD